MSPDPPPAPAPPAFGVYVHFPWCARVCPYCDFNVHRDDDIPHARYADALLAQWRADGPAFGAAAPGSVFLGGGSPSLWAPGQVRRVLDALAPAPGAEVTLEANPEDADPARFAALAEAGVGRLSLGAQSFDASVLARLGRLHSPDDVRRAVALGRDAGFPRVSLDLIYGVPGQSAAAWRATLAEAVATGAGHVSAYCLTIEPGTRFAADGVQAADDDLAVEMGRAATADLAAAGLARYEVSNFARPGQESRHNLLYWTGGEWLGLGAGAWSARGPRRWRAVRRPADYMAAALAGRPVEDPAHGETLDADALRRERLMMGLRLVAGTPDPGARPDALARLRAAGLLAPDEGDRRIAATARGMEVLDAVVAALDPAGRRRPDGLTQTDGPNT